MKLWNYFTKLSFESFVILTLNNVIVFKIKKGFNMDYKIELTRKQALGALYKLSKNKETFSVSYADITRALK